jgi:hypothetical protein
MNQYSRQFLRDRFLAEQQRQLTQDEAVDDPSVAYLQLVEELWSASNEEVPVDRAA